MNEGELRSLCQQLGYSYSSCVHGQPQAHLHLLGLKGSVLEMMQQKHGTYANWVATTSQDTYAEYFKVGGAGGGSGRRGKGWGQEGAGARGGSGGGA
jgi:hypothetical protein